MTIKQNSKMPQQITARIGDLHDLSDFCPIWPEIREHIKVDDQSISESLVLDIEILK